MIDPAFPIAALPPELPTCRECGVPLGPDQRYCVSCGARCVALPGQRGRLATPPAATPRLTPAGAGVGATVESRAAAFLATLPPRAAAVAVMSMLAFGVVVGSGATSLASPSTPLILAYAPPQAAPTAVSAPASSADGGGGGSGGAGGGGGGTTTVVQTVAAQTVTAPNAASGGGGGAAPPATGPTGSALPPIKHVFVVMLSSQGFRQLYGPGSSFPYLAKTLRNQGELLHNYYGVASSGLANGIAMLSGQGPTQQTSLNCPQYTLLSPGTFNKDKQAQGDGCVYPVRTQNLPDQLTANGQTWKAYIEGMSTVTPATGTATTGTTLTATTVSATTSASTTSSGAGTTGTAPAGTPTACRRPNLGTADPSHAATQASPYVTWRNPFVYLQSITQSPNCAQQDVSLEALAKDLSKETTTPSLVYIAPSPCHGSQVSCAPGKPADPKAAATATDAFLKTVITEIQASTAYKAGGLIAITADNAPQTGPDADPSACCNNPVYPNLPVPATTSSSSTTQTTSSTMTNQAPPASSGSSTIATTTSAPTATTTGTTSTSRTTPTTAGANTATPVAGGQTTTTGGGGQVGMLLLSKYVKPGSEDTLDYFNHYSLLGSIEQLFSLNRLGYAADPQLTLFTAGVVYNHYSG